jgi:3-keto-5-aminohexanoate cleavage enzyme
MEELIICVAPCPDDNQVEKFPAGVNVVEEVTRAHNAGASIVHLHVRDEEGRQTADTTVFSDQVKEIRKTIQMVIEGSTGGTVEHTLAERCVSIAVPGIELGSLNLGSINMAGGVYHNPMSDVRYYATEMKNRKIKPVLNVFDLSMFNNARQLEAEGLLEGTKVYNMVFDIQDTLPFSREILFFFLSLLPEDAVWFLSRHHAQGWPAFRDALEHGGHVRVGYEDSPFLSTGKHARDNAEIVEEMVKSAHQIGRRVVDSKRAREIIGISQKNP